MAALSPAQQKLALGDFIWDAGVDLGLTDDLGYVIGALLHRDNNDLVVVVELRLAYLLRELWVCFAAGRGLRSR